MKTVIAWIKKVLGLFKKRTEDLDSALDVVLNALPAAYEIVSIVAAITPSELDDLVLARVRTLFPKLFDETLTADERKLYLLAVATELLRHRFPQMTTSLARLAVQLAYVVRKHKKELEQ